MPWTVKIVHIGLVGKGDATYISAVNGGTRRGVLIDGGMAGEWQFVRDAIAAEATGLDVMVATHYDADHLGGLTALLLSGNAPYNAVRLYDQGESGIVRAKVSKRRRLDGGGGVATKIDFDIAGREAPVDAYVKAAQALPHLNRLTEKVMSVSAVPDALQGIFLDADTLVGREIMWDDQATLATRPDPNNIPDGAPTLTCVAANQYVLQPDGNHLLRSSGLGGTTDRGKNARSLAFLLEFGDFHYYVGGDLEKLQENALAQYIVSRSASDDNVQVMKTSHHGSVNSTSNAFLRALRPAAAIISCGRNNSHGHPDQEVVNFLDALGIDYYVTGDDVRDGTTQLGALGCIAGGGDNDGTIVVKVTAAQQAADPVQWDMMFRRPNAGYNINKAEDFKYTPAKIVTEKYR